MKRRLFKWALPAIFGMCMLQSSLIAYAEATQTDYTFSGHLWLKIHIHPSSKFIEIVEDASKLALKAVGVIGEFIPYVNVVPTSLIAEAATPIVTGIEDFALNHLETIIPLDPQQVPVKRDGNVISFVISHSIKHKEDTFFNINMPISGIIDDTNHLNLVCCGLNINVGTEQDPKQIIVEQNKKFTPTGHGKQEEGALGFIFSSADEENSPPFVVNGDIAIRHHLLKHHPIIPEFLHPHISIGKATIGISSWRLNPVSQPVPLVGSSAQPASSVHK